MKRLIHLFLIAVLISVLVSSCSKDDSEYSLGDFWISLGFVETENTFGYEYIIYTDNGDTLLPSVNEVPQFNVTNKKRVLVNYTILDEVGTAKHKFYIRTNNLSDVLYKEIIDLTPENSDSIGNDPIHVTNIWMSDSILNMEFQYYGGNLTHYINLATENNVETMVKEPVALKFLHNANKDEPLYTLNGLVSFNLERLKKEGQDSVNFQVVYTDYNNQFHTIDGTYNY